MEQRGSFILAVCALIFGILVGMALDRSIKHEYIFRVQTTENDVFYTHRTTNQPTKVVEKMFGLGAILEVDSSVIRIPDYMIDNIFYVEKP